MPQTMPQTLSELPIAFSIRPSSSIPCVRREENVVNKENICYIRDAYEDCIYYVRQGLPKPQETNEIGWVNYIKKGDEIIFNGTDNYGFDMGIITDVCDDDFQIEYIEFLNDSPRPSRNLNILPTPSDFSKKPFYLPVYGGGKAVKLTMRFKKYNEPKNRRWYLVLHKQTEEEYVDEVVNINEELFVQVDTESEAELNNRYPTSYEGNTRYHCHKCVEEYVDEVVNVNDERFVPVDTESDTESDTDLNNRYPTSYEGNTRYHCHKCVGETPMTRERCRRTTDNKALTAYAIAAENAANGEGEYANDLYITTWRVLIDGNDYHIDYNNVLYSYEGAVLGYAKPSDTPVLDELFEPVFFDNVDRPPSPAPPTYPNPPEYKE